MTTGVYTMTTVNLPPAVIGVAYEAAVAWKATAPSEVTAQSISNLPEGLSVDAVSTAHGSVRITGTPTGASNGSQSGPGAYTLSVSMTDGTGTDTGTLTLNLYNSYQDLVSEGAGRGSQDGLN